MSTVLVVDDMPDNLRLVRRLLTGPDFRVLEALSADEALAISASAMPDMILVDLRLGDGSMTGYELAGRLRKLPGGRAAVIVALTGGARLEDEAESAVPGFDAFILKPFEFGEFSNRLKGYLAEKAKFGTQENGAVK